MKNKILILFRFVKMIFYQDENTKKMVKFYKQKFKKNKKYENEFLIDYFESHETEIARSYFINTFCNLKKCNLKVFSLNKNILLNYNWRRIYKSFNAIDFNYVYLSFTYLLFLLNIKKRSEVSKVFNSIKSKNDILKLEYKKIEIGRDVYDEYLYRYKKYTIDVNDKKLKNVIFEFYYLIDYWIEYFQNKQVLGISLSHPNVRLLGIIGKIANGLFKIPVYSITNTYIRKNMQLSNHYKFIREGLMDIPRKFKKLNKTDQYIALDLAKKRLNQRLSGQIGVDMPYSKDSAFAKKKLKKTLNSSDKIKILICTHELHDNPHSTGGMLFPDFYEWLLFLAEKSKKSNFEWYIKNHPDCDKWTKNVVQKFVDEHKDITLINEKTSFLQLKEEGLKFVLTCHGTVGHECPLLGIDVINADLNHPHIAYDFNWSPKSIEEYSDILDNLDKIKKKIDKKDIYEFYFVRNLMENKDDLILNSYEDAIKKKKEKSLSVLDTFLQQVDHDRHFQILKNVSSYI